MDIFSMLDGAVSNTVDVVNAIPFTLTPMLSTPNGRPGVDPGRPAVSGLGIFDYTSVEYGVQLGVRRSYREANDLRALQVGREPQLSIDRKYFPSSEDEPRQGDVLTFPSHSELPQFQVISCQRDGLSRLVLVLVQIGAQG